MIIDFSNSRKVGRFVISLDLVKDKPMMIQEIMAKCIIVRCELLAHMWSFEYHAICSQFTDISEGQTVPTYLWEFKNGRWEAHK